MDHSEDVDRLFSWLKAPMLHYREFAAQREVSDAVATWPVAYRAAVQTGLASENDPAPQGDAAAKERLARDRMMLPTRPMQHVAPAEAAPCDPRPEPGGMSVAAADPALASRGRERPLGETAAEAAANDAALAHSAEVASEPQISGFEPQPLPPYEPPQPAAGRMPPPVAAPAAPPAAYDARPAEPPRHYPAPERMPLFASEYRTRERGGWSDGGQSDSRPSDRQDRSLEAVFSRLAGGRDRLPDPRARARTSPGLRPVFNRLR